MTEAPTKSTCPSCGGLNTSCPEGCGRDENGELDGSTLEADLDALVEGLRAKTARLLESRHATAAYAIQDALFAITSLRKDRDAVFKEMMSYKDQLTASEARERELREALTQITEDRYNLSSSQELVELLHGWQQIARTALTNTENQV